MFVNKEIPGTTPAWILDGVGIIWVSVLFEDNPAPNSNSKVLSDKILETKRLGVLCNCNK